VNISHDVAHDFTQVDLTVCLDEWVNEFAGLAWGRPYSFVKYRACLRSAGAEKWRYLCCGGKGAHARIVGTVVATSTNTGIPLGGIIVLRIDAHGWMNDRIAGGHVSDFVVVVIVVKIFTF
jgi:hypothetical protein